MPHQLKHIIGRIGLGLLVCLMHTNVQAQNDGFYNIKIDSLGTGKIDMSSYANKPTLIWLVDSANLNAKSIKQFDSLWQANRAKLSVLVVPCADCGILPNNVDLRKLFKSQNPSIPVAAPGISNRKSEGKQNKLLNWLCKKEENTHFDFDFSGKTSHLFLIASNGTLVGHYENLNDFSKPIFNRVFAKVK